MASMMNHDVSIGVVTICTRQNSKAKIMIIKLVHVLLYDDFVR